MNERQKMKDVGLKWIVSIACFSLLFVGCAFDLAHVDFKEATLSACSKNCPTITILSEKLLSNMPCGYDRTIKKDSEWSMVGTIDTGDVYKPLNQCFTVECSNIFEAYLVISDSWLNGFYLPVEDGYVALDEPTELELK